MSSPDAAVLESAINIAGLSIVQTPLSPAQTSTRAVLLRLQAAKIAVIANQIFLSGRLLGTPRPTALTTPRVMRN